MPINTMRIARVSLVVFGLVVSAVLADDLAVDWYSIDGGGVMHSTGGGFVLSGTVGQPDAGVVMTGGEFELSGGFWAVPACWCLSDVNHDGRRDGRDVQEFVNCLMAFGGDCACADVETDGALDLMDVVAFVDDLLGGSPCP